MKTFKQFLYEQMLLESPFDDAKRKWTTVDHYNDGNVQAYIDTFKMLRDKNQLSGVEKDISYWVNKDFKEFSDFVNTHRDNHERKSILKAKSKDATKVFENENCAIFNINSYEASCKYGSGTKWCITMQDTDQYWNDYHRKNHVNFFFIISKTEPKDNPYYKIAVAVYPESVGGILEIYDAEDKRIFDDEWERILEEDDIPEEIFKPQIVVTMSEKVANCKTREEAIELLNSEWFAINRNNIKWTSDMKSAIIYTAVNIEEFIDIFGNDTAKNIVNNDTDHNMNPPFDNNVEDAFNLLDINKVDQYLMDHFPDDQDDWEDDQFTFIRRNDDDLIVALESAALDGEAWGAEKEMNDALVETLRRFPITDNDGDEIYEDAAWIDTKTMYNGKINVYTSFNVVLFLLSEEKCDITEGFGFDISVKTPYYGWGDFDIDGAKEYLKNSDYDYMVK